jgi:hypothetical protein
MVEIPLLDSSEAPRARRWDALVLGSGVAALVAAARIGRSGQRVLVVEEEARTRLPPALREPAFLAGLRDEGVLDATLRLLSVPLIDRRRLVPERLAYQIAADPYRLDIGPPPVTADELVTWGLAKPEAAQRLVRHLVEASEIERRRLLDAPIARLGRRLGVSRGSGLGDHKRGLPGEVGAAEGALAQVIAAQTRCLSNLGRSRPSPEAQTRLLGLGLGGGIGFGDDPPWLVDLIRKRVTGLFGEFRTLAGDFELVSVSGQPGVRLARSGEIWLGRVLVLAAPLSALRDRMGGDPMHPTPSLLDHETSRAYRAAFLFRIPKRILPEGMGARVILPGTPEGAGETTGTGRSPAVMLTAFPSQTHPDCVELVARAVLDDATPEHLEEARRSLADSITRRLEQLMPFSQGELQEIGAYLPQWDSDDGWLEDPTPGNGWPAEADLRLSSRPPIVHLDRAAVAGLGLEGDLLLGWRGGDAIAAELA